PPPSTPHTGTGSASVSPSGTSGRLSTGCARTCTACCPTRRSSSTRSRRQARSATQDFLGRGHRRERVALPSRATAVPRLAKPARRNGHAPFKRPRDSHVDPLAIGPVGGGG